MLFFLLELSTLSNDADFSSPRSLWSRYTSLHIKLLQASRFYCLIFFALRIIYYTHRFSDTLTVPFICRERFSARAILYIHGPSLMIAICLLAVEGRIRGIIFYAPNLFVG